MSLMETIKQMWNEPETPTPEPPADDYMQATPALLEAIANYHKTKADHEAAKAEIKQILGDHSGAKDSNGRPVVTWTEQERTSVDTEKLRDTGLYGQFSKTTLIRVLRVK